MPHVRSGKLLAVAVLSDRRFTLLPTVPTSAEMGFPNLNAVSWAIKWGPPVKAAAIKAD